MLKKTILVRSLATAFGGAAVIAAMPAMAQQSPEQNVQRVVVTGSLISRTDKETPSPVQVLTADDLAKSGLTSIAEVLSNLSANGQGALGTGFAGAFANGGSGVSLRGLTVGLTLVLIDGKRMAPYPLSDDAQRQFVDVSSIPFDAVERVEVLKDGASAMYGSDAVSGVVNVILKKTFNGTNIKVDAGNSQHGGGQNHKVALTHGFGDLANDGYNAFASLEYRHADPIKVSQRDDQIWANGNWTSRGGIDLRRGVPNASNSRLIATNTPFFYNPTGPALNGSAANNPANYQFLTNDCDFNKYRAGGCAIRDTVSNIQPESRNLNVIAGFAKTLGEDWTLNLKASMFKRESQNNRGVPATFSPTSFLGNTSLVPGQNPQIVNNLGATTFPASYPLNKLGATARLYGYIPGIDPANSRENTATSTRFAADVKGSAMGWDIDAGVGMTKVKTEIDYSGYVNRGALYTALKRAVNPFNPLGGNSQADIDAISPRWTNESESKLNYANLVAQRELAQLPGGPLSLATGVSVTKKEINALPSPLLSQGVVGSGEAYTFGKETNSALFAELGALPIKGLELGAAARYDHYDTYGNSFTPSAKFKWTPVPMASLRGTFARGFRAPNSAEVGTASSFFTFHSINDPILCANGNPNTAGNVPSACAFGPAFVQVTTPNLEPEKSKSFTLGLVLEPIKSLSATIDYYNIEVKNQINTASGVPGFVPTYVRNTIAPVEISNGDGTTSQGLPSVGTIAYATSGYVNSGGTSTSGVELDLTYRLNMGEAGKLRTTLSFNHMIDYKLESNGVEYSLAGTHGPSVISGNTGNPKNRGQLTLSWEKGPMTVTSTTNWVGNYSALDPSLPDDEGMDCAHATNVSSRTYFFGGTVPAGYCRIPSFASTDLNVTYKVSKNLTLRGSIINAFDKAPPIDVATYGNSGNLTSYNASLHQAGAVGRFFSIGASYSF
ncbi:iron complex outermembrane recepter protein [Duganella sp. CF458]|uniref:TonB-dependent receptor n=1 Tax=Duganella sp. CF458 TaxID=1884368 RepID=UPI0008ED84CE|nr:TonB-dependent receptor [Duganella sp. CF458]SFG00197.1 iron complex outermembrane recepter protein [Duganella sp. CF458]